ncbi:hypothetical protein TorRG33x02_326410, partial [Trema orientale]
RRDWDGWSRRHVGPDLCQLAQCWSDRVLLVHVHPVSLPIKARHITWSKSSLGSANETRVKCRAYHFPPHRIIALESEIE